MLRRLFFLVPDESQAAKLVADLEAVGVAHRHIHAVGGRGRTLSRLPPATVRQTHDWVWRIEQIWWYANLGLFFAAAAGFVAALLSAQYLWAVVAAVVMIGTLASGAWFSLRVPDTHLAEFRQALAHGEILLMVNVPKGRVAEIEDLVRKRHPETVPGGVGWTFEAFGI
jgi:hypothetical protein